MNKATIAKKYMAALFNETSTDESILQSDLTIEAIDYILHFKQLHQILSIPTIELEKKIECISPLFENINNKKVENLISLLIKNNKIPMLKELKVQLEEKRRELQGQCHAHIETALPLSEAEEIEIKDLLEKKFQKKMDIYISINKDIISGFKVTIGNQQLDATLNRVMEKFKEKFKV